MRALQIVALIASLWWYIKEVRHCVPFVSDMTISEYDQKCKKSHIRDQHTAPQRRDKEP